MSNSIANAVVLDQAKPSGKRQQLKPAQRACYDVLRLAVREGHVFAALTGPSGSGKTTILEALLAELRGPSLRCIRVREPQKVSAQLASQIEQAAYSEARKPDNVGRHLLLVVDDAHAGSAELLSCVTRIAEMREPGRRVPQILLVGGATLWERLAADEYQPLARSLAIRTALPAAEEDDGLWASVEQGMAPTARSLHPDAIRLLQTAAPDPPAAPPTQMRGRGLRLFVPLGLFLLSAGASVYSLSLHRWPDFLNGLSWERINPSAPPGRASSPRDPTPPAAPPARSTPSPVSTPAARPANPTSKLPAEAVMSVPQAVTPAPKPVAQVVAVPPPVTVTVSQPIVSPAAPPSSTANMRFGSPLSPQISALLLQRGKERLADGDISAARLLFQRAAEGGSAEGARLVARTYDEAFLPPLDASTFADQEKAQMWYSRGAQLGGADVASRRESRNASE